MINLLPTVFLLAGCNLVHQKKSDSDSDQRVQDRESYPVSGGVGCCSESDQDCASSEEIDWIHEGLWYAQEEHDGRHKFISMNSNGMETYYCRDYYDPKPHLNALFSAPEREQKHRYPKLYPDERDCFFTNSARTCVYEDSEADFSGETIDFEDVLLLACPQGWKNPYIVYPDEEDETCKFECQEVFHPSVEYKRLMRDKELWYLKE